MLLFISAAFSKQLLLICCPFRSHSCLLLACVRLCLWVRTHAFVWQSHHHCLRCCSEMTFFPHDSVAFSRTANQGSGTGMSCRDAARHQAATTVCRLISAPYCHFVKSHYSNENRSGKAMTEQGYGWAVCQRQSDFIFPCSLFELRELGLGGGGRGRVGCGREVVASFYCVMCHCQGCSPCSFCFQSCYWLGHISLMNECQLHWRTEI